MYVRGTEINYYFICKTKLWLFSHNITVEHESDSVKLGKLLHDEVFQRDTKDITVGPISIDIVRKGDELEIREVKKSSKMERAHEYQCLYYIYYLKKYGIRSHAMLSYPKVRRNVRVVLDEEREREMEIILKRVEEIKLADNPPGPKLRKICRKCAYFEFCFS